MLPHLTRAAGGSWVEGVRIKTFTVQTTKKGIYRYEVGIPARSRYTRIPSFWTISTKMQLNLFGNQYQEKDSPYSHFNKNDTKNSRDICRYILQYTPEYRIIFCTTPQRALKKKKKKTTQYTSTGLEIKNRFHKRMSREKNVA